MYDVCYQRDVLDDDCVTEMSVHYGRSRQEVKETLAEWRYDYFTATYLLLLNKKSKGRPVRLARPRVLMHRQLVSCPPTLVLAYFILLFNYLSQNFFTYMSS